eukprot:Clim_evm4s27 gene=Clim_evmTU4s27
MAPNITVEPSAAVIYDNDVFSVGPKKRASSKREKISPVHDVLVNLQRGLSHIAGVDAEYAMDSILEEIKNEETNARIDLSLNLLKEQLTLPSPTERHGTSWSSAQAVKETIACFALFLLPFLRFVGFVLTGLVGIAWIRLCVIGYKPKYDARGYPKPLSRTRKFLLTQTQGLARVLCFFVGFHNIEVYGRRDHRTRILVSNHVSYMDAFLLQSFVTTLPLASTASQTQPIYSQYINAVQGIWVDRGGSVESKRKVTKAILQRVGNPNYFPILVFPEGTCGNNKALMRFKAGIFSAGAPVQPVVLRYKTGTTDPGWTNFNSSWAWLRLFCRWNNGLEIHFMPTVRPSDIERQNPVLFAERTRRLMAKRLRVPCVPHGVEDLQLENDLVNAGAIQTFKRDAWYVEARQRLDISAQRRLLRKFLNHDPERKGEIEFMEFCRMCNLSSDSIHARRLYTAFGGIVDLADGEPAPITWRKFLAAFHMQAPGSTMPERAAFAWVVYNGTTLADSRQCSDASAISSTSQVGGVTLAALATIMNSCHSLHANNVGNRGLPPRKGSIKGKVAVGAYGLPHALVADFLQIAGSMDAALEIEEFLSLATAHPNVLDVMPPALMAEDKEKLHNHM